jgi:hypothetical protein
MQPDRGPDGSREEKKDCSDADNEMTQGRKQELLASPAVKCADIEHADNPGEIGDQDPDQGPELTEKGELFISHWVQQDQQRKVEQRDSYFVARIFRGDSYDKGEKSEAVPHECLVEQIQVRVGGMDYGMDQAAASQDDKAGTHKKDPAALDLIAGYLKAAGPECPDSDQQAYYGDKNFLAVMISQEEFL